MPRGAATRSRRRPRVLLQDLLVGLTVLVASPCARFLDTGISVVPAGRAICGMTGGTTPPMSCRLRRRTRTGATRRVSTRPRPAKRAERFDRLACGSLGTPQCDLSLASAAKQGRQRRSPAGGMLNREMRRLCRQPPARGDRRDFGMTRPRRARSRAPQRSRPPKTPLPTPSFLPTAHRSVANRSTQPQRRARRIRNAPPLLSVRGGMRGVQCAACGDGRLAAFSGADAVDLITGLAWPLLVGVAR